MRTHCKNTKKLFCPQLTTYALVAVFSCSMQNACVQEQLTAVNQNTISMKKICTVSIKAGWWRSGWWFWRTGLLFYSTSSFVLITFHSILISYEWLLHCYIVRIVLKLQLRTVAGDLWYLANFSLASKHIFHRCQQRGTITHKQEINFSSVAVNTTHEQWFQFQIKKVTFFCQMPYLASTTG